MRISSVGNERRHPRSQEAGVTLLELVIVLAILSLAMSLVAPRFGNWSDEWTLRSAAERVAQTVRYARTRALFEQSYYVVEIEPSAGLVRVFNPASGFSRGFTLPRGVKMTARIPRLRSYDSCSHRPGWWKRGTCGSVTAVEANSGSIWISCSVLRPSRPLNKDHAKCRGLSNVIVGRARPESASWKF
jgi:prepilin-type N-terminal cleavage/methylation domain-containing protein